jgi:hypothetical protein
MPEIPDEDAPIIINSSKKRSASESIDIHNDKSNNDGNKRIK